MQTRPKFKEVIFLPTVHYTAASFLGRKASCFVFITRRRVGFQQLARSAGMRERCGCAWECEQSLAFLFFFFEQAVNIQSGLCIFFFFLATGLGLP